MQLTSTLLFEHQEVDVAVLVETVLDLAAVDVDVGDTFDEDAAEDDDWWVNVKLPNESKRFCNSELMSSWV